MRINVNEYNEILSYEGTPAELAEFVELGVFGEWVPADQVALSNDEDCGCNDEMGEVVSYTVPDSFEEDVVSTSTNVNSVPEVEIPDSYDAADHKAEVRAELESRGIKLSDEEFNEYYEMAIIFAHLFDDLLN